MPEVAVRLKTRYDGCGPATTLREPTTLHYSTLTAVVAVAFSAAQVPAALSTAPDASARLSRPPASGVPRHRPCAAWHRPASSRSSAVSGRAPEPFARPADAPLRVCAGSRSASGRTPSGWLRLATG